MPLDVGSHLMPEFFRRSAEKVARALLDMALARRRGRSVVCYTITETEAYVGPHDLACHTSRGRTRRTEPMFGPPGSPPTSKDLQHTLDAQRRYR